MGFQFADQRTIFKVAVNYAIIPSVAILIAIKAPNIFSKFFRCRCLLWSHRKRKSGKDRGCLRIIFLCHTRCRKEDFFV
jgi:hypothetical protein